MDKENQASKKEHLFYGLYFFGQNLLWMFAGLISTYLLDIGIDASDASLMIIGPKIWDAVNDALFGYLVDRQVISKKERFLPWIKLGSLLIGFSIIVLFAIPEKLTDNVKMIWFVIAYIIFDGAYTMLDAPIYAMPVEMTGNIQERGKLVSDGKLGGILGGAVAAILVPVVRPYLGWSPTAVIFSVVGAGVMWPFILCAKERNHSKQDKESYHLSQIITYLKGNRYLMVMLGVMLVIGCTSIEQVLALILARNCFESEAYATIITAMGAIPMLAITILLPRMIMKWDKVLILEIGLGFSIVMSIICYFVGYDNGILSMIMLAFKGVGGAFYLVITYMCIADTVEYGNYKTGVRASGITFSMQAFVSKLKNAMINSIALGALALYGYNSDLPDEARQAPEVVKGIWQLFNLLPALGYLVAVLMLVLLYTLKDKDVQIMASFNNNQLSRKEAEEALSRKY